jgi:hypothetical protein
MTVERKVVLLLAGVVVAVLALSVVSAYVAPIGEALRNVPLVIVALVVVTATVLFVALRPRRG